MAVTGPVQSFSFSFTAPTFVTAGSTPAFTPFTVTDGTNIWTMTKDLIALFDPTGLNRGCFMFGTPSAGLGVGVNLSGGPPGPCGVGVGGPEGALEFDTGGGLPTAPGTYPAVSFTGLFDMAAGSFESITSQFNPTGTMSLTISLSPTAEKGRFNTKLTGFHETPSILTNGTGTFTARSFSDLLRILRSGDAYVNVHTANHPAGEIRGQLAIGDE